jgi:aryl-alcohol dehydrogenase-like predicted oxidoreductase
MKYRKLGNTGMVISSLGLGTMYSPGGYPYGEFGKGQRSRSLETSAQALGSLAGSGSERPLGRV